MVVRSRSSLRQPLLVALAAFALTVAGILSYSFISAQWVFQTGSKAVARVSIKPTADIASLGADFPLRSPEIYKKIERRLADAGFLQHVLHNCDIQTSSNVENHSAQNSSVSLDELLQSIDIHTKPGKANGEQFVSVEITLAHSPDARKIAQNLAESFVSEYRAFWAAEARKVYLETLEGLQESQKKHCEAKEKYQSLLLELASRQQANQQYAEKKSVAKQTAPIVVRTKPFPVENRDWTEIARKLRSLKLQEADLLRQMTQLHPQVKYLREKIGDVQLQLATTPHWVTKRSPDHASKPSNNPSPTAPLAKGEGSTKDEQLQKLLKQASQSLSLSEQELLEKSRAEKEIYKACRQEPLFAISLQPLRIRTARHKTAKNHWKFIFLSAFSMAISAGVFSSGINIQPVLGTIANLEPLLPVPIIGLAPRIEPQYDPLTRRRRQNILRWSMIFLGAFTICGCLVGTCWFLVNL
ncbi:MAG: hypothetical protein ACWGMZ_12185 [Thermoguttaceae bacterium]